MSDPQTPQFHGRRRGRPLRPGRQERLARLLPALSIALDADIADPRDLFPGWPEDVWLEIGFGAGEHLAAVAAANPATGCIGCEPFINGVARLVDRIDSDGLSNIRIVPDDARLLLDRLPDACLGRVFILFPDPWPKKRHWRRRIVGPDTLPVLARVMRPGAELRLATDHPGYLRWMLWHLHRSNEFDWLDEGPRDWRSRREDGPPTRYEEKRLEGRPIFLRYRRRPDRSR